MNGERANAGRRVLDTRRELLKDLTHKTRCGYLGCDGFASMSACVSEDKRDGERMCDKCGWLHGSLLSRTSDPEQLLVRLIQSDPLSPYEVNLTWTDAMTRKDEDPPPCRIETYLRMLCFRLGLQHSETQRCLLILRRRLLDHDAVADMLDAQDEPQTAAAELFQLEAASLLSLDSGTKQQRLVAACALAICSRWLGLGLLAMIANVADVPHSELTALLLAVDAKEEPTGRPESAAAAFWNSEEWLERWLRLEPQRTLLGSRMQPHASRLQVLCRAEGHSDVCEVSESKLKAIAGLARAMHAAWHEVWAGGASDRTYDSLHTAAAVVVAAIHVDSVWRRHSVGRQLLDAVAESIGVAPPIMRIATYTVVDSLRSLVARYGPTGVAYSREGFTLLTWSADDLREMLSMWMRGSARRVSGQLQKPAEFVAKRRKIAGATVAKRRRKSEDE